MRSVIVGRCRRLVVAAVNHPLADCALLSLPELRGEPELRARGACPGWTMQWSIASLTGESVVRGGEFTLLSEAFDLVAAGHGIILAPDGAQRRFARADLCWIALHRAGGRRGAPCVASQERPSQPRRGFRDRVRAGRRRPGRHDMRPRDRRRGAANRLLSGRGGHKPASTCVNPGMDHAAQRAGEELRDPELLTAARNGDGDAFGAFYRRHRAITLAYLCRRTQDPEVAADLLGESFAAALACVMDPGQELPESPVAWLLTVARNKLIDSWRRGQVEAAARERLGMQPLRLTDFDIAESIGSPAKQICAKALKACCPPISCRH